MFKYAREGMCVCVRVRGKLRVLDTDGCLDGKLACARNVVCEANGARTAVVLAGTRRILNVFSNRRVGA